MIAIRPPIWLRRLLFVGLFLAAAWWLGESLRLTVITVDRPLFSPMLELKVGSGQSIHWDRGLLLQPGMVLTTVPRADWPLPQKMIVDLDLLNGRPFDFGVKFPEQSYAITIHEPPWTLTRREWQGVRFEFTYAKGRLFLTDQTGRHSGLEQEAASDSAPALFLANRWGLLRLRHVQLQWKNPTGEWTQQMEKDLSILWTWRAPLFWVLGLVGLGLALGLETLAARRHDIDRISLRRSFLFTTAPLALFGYWLAWSFVLEKAVLLLAGLWVFCRFRFWALRANFWMRRPQHPWWHMAAAAGWIGLPVAWSIGMSSPTGFRDSALSALPSATAVTALILGWQVLVARSLETKVRQHLSMCGRLLMVYPLAAVLFFIIGNQAWWLMPVGVLFLATPLEHQRAELRRYGWHMLASFCLFLLFLEASVTHGPVASYARPLRMGAQYRPADNLLWIPDNLAPGTDRGLYLHEMPIMERLSFRGHEGLSSGKPPCVFRILLLGGSNAWGHGQPTNDTTFAGLLERSLRARSWNAEVINAGFCGYRSFQSLLVLKQIGRLYRPDVVIFYGGRNDQSNPRGPYTYRQLAGLDRGNPNVLAVQRSLQRGGLYNLLTTGIVAARGRVLEQFDLPVFRETNPPSDYRRNLADMADVARQLGAKMVFAQEFFGLNLSDMETNAEWLELFNSMKETAAANGALFLDAYHYFANQPEPLRHVLPDDPVHFNAAGHAAMARYLEQALTDNGALPARAPCAPAIAAAGAQ